MGADMHDPNAQTSTPPGFKILQSEKLRADSSIPILGRFHAIAEHLEKSEALIVRCFVGFRVGGLAHCST